MYVLPKMHDEHDNLVKLLALFTAMGIDVEIVGETEEEATIKIKKLERAKQCRNRNDTEWQLDYWSRIDRTNERKQDFRQIYGSHQSMHGVDP